MSDRDVVEGLLVEEFYSKKNPRMELFSPGPAPREDPLAEACGCEANGEDKAELVYHKNPVPKLGWDAFQGVLQRLEPDMRDLAIEVYAGARVGYNKSPEGLQPRTLVTRLATLTRSHRDQSVSDINNEIIRIAGALGIDH